MTVKRRDRGAEKMLRRLLQKGALSVGILAAEASEDHAQKITREEKAESKLLNSAVKRGQFLSGKQFARQESLNAKKAASGITIGEIAEIHEFGLGNCPRRSFLADWADGQRSQIDRVIIKGAQALARGSISEPVQFLEQVGAWAVGSIKRRMASNIPPPLAPTTIQRKGSSVALIDTGQLRSSITYRVDAVGFGKTTFVQKTGGT